MKSKKNRRSKTTGSTRIGQITLTKTAFASLLDTVLYPNPADSGPLSPGGQVIQRWMWDALNPPPLTPGHDP